MKKALLILAIALGAAACTVEETPFSAQGGQTDQGQKPTMTVTACTELTRTTLRGNDTDGYDVLWSTGDDFKLMYKFGRMYSYRGYLTFNISSGAGSTSARFSTTDTFASDSFNKPDICVYPASMVPDSIFLKSSSLAIPLDWPSEQEYLAGTAGRAPMISDVTDLEGTLTFRNLGGILRLRVKGSGTITAIRIRADQKMSGASHLSDSGIVMEYPEGEDGSIVLDCGNGVQLSESGVDFHFNVPVGTYTGFKVEFYDGDLLIGTRSSKKDIVIERSRITPATMTAPVLTPGKLISVGKTKVKTAAELIEMAKELAGDRLGANASYLNFLLPFDLNIVPVTYATTDVDGKLTAASGLIAYPDLSKDTYNYFNYYRIVSIQHGTCDIAEAPSGQDLPMELLPAAVGIRHGTTLTDLLFGEYFIACMADYLGYGATENSDLLHPYLHNKLTGSTCADLITATGEYIEECGLEVITDEVNLVGYSQGGAATISTMLELLDRDETTWASRIGEVWAGAGPYDIPAFIDYFALNQSYSRSCYIPYAMRGLAYGEGLSIDWDNVYSSNVGGKGKSGSQLESEIFSKTQVSTWTDVIGTDVTQILNPDFYGDGNSDIRSLMEAAISNSVTNCTEPDASMKEKIRLYHSLFDDTVPYVCSTKLQEAWDLGDINELAPSDHVEAGVEFLLEFCGVNKLMESTP